MKRTLLHKRSITIRQQYLKKQIQYPFCSVNDVYSVHLIKFNCDLSKRKINRVVLRNLVDYLYANALAS